MNTASRFRLAAMCLAAFVLTVIPAILHGTYTHRWGPSADLTLAAQRLDDCPDQIGPWQRVGESDFSDNVVRELKLEGYLNRSYVNQRSGERVALMLLLGAPGALSRHPPEICYAARGGQRLRDPADVQLTAADQFQHSFRVLRYRHPGRTGEQFVVCYGFTTDGTWSIPRFPRLTFGGEVLLYKMQVLHAGDLPEAGRMPKSVSEFLSEFLPILRERVINTSSSSAPGSP